MAKYAVSLKRDIRMWNIRTGKVLWRLCMIFFFLPTRRLWFLLMNGTVFSGNQGAGKRAGGNTWIFFVTGWRISPISVLPIWQGYFRSRSMEAIPHWICLRSIPWPIPKEWDAIWDLPVMKLRGFVHSIRWALKTWGRGMTAIRLKGRPQFTALNR